MASACFKARVAPSSPIETATTLPPTASRICSAASIAFSSNPLMSGSTFAGLRIFMAVSSIRKLSLGASGSGTCLRVTMISTHLSFVLHCHTMLRDETVGKSLAHVKKKTGGLLPSSLIPVRRLGHVVTGIAQQHGAIFLLQIMAIALIRVLHPDLCHRGLGCVAHNNVETPVVTAEDRFAAVIHIHLLRWTWTA